MRCLGMQFEHPSFPKLWQLLRLQLASVALLLLLVSCNAYNPWIAPSEQQDPGAPRAEVKPVYSVFLVGDAGKNPSYAPTPALQALETQLERTYHANALIFLGDNIYEEGLPPDSVPNYLHYRDYMDSQLEVARTRRGPTVFIPGNHDWNGGTQTGGWAAVKRQEAYIESQLNHPKTHLPNGGCPGPAVRKLGERWAVIVLDTHWWMHPHKSDRPVGANSPCQHRTEDEILRALDDSIRTLEGRKVLIVGHHPLFSNGAHGDHYTLEDHLFPLRMAKKWLWLPLPGLGSLYPLGRRWSKNPTDITNPDYKRMKQGLLKVLRRHPNSLYACGHEHGLQYFHLPEYAGLHHIVSGAGSKYSNHRKGFGAGFVYSYYGFAVLREYADGTIMLEYFAPKKDAPAQPELVFRKRVSPAQNARAHPPGVR